MALVKSIIPLILYPWAIVSAIVLIRRVYRKQGSNPATPPLGDGLGPAGAPPDPTRQSVAGSAAPPAIPHVRSSTPAPPATASGTAGLEPSVAAALAAEGRLPTGATSPPAATTGAAGVGSVGSVGGAGDTGPGRAGYFAATPATDPQPTRRPLPELLAGIELPCDLVPVVRDRDIRIVDIHAAFLASGYEPAEVGRRLGDELERLGYTLGSESEQVVIATRDDGRLRVTLHPDAAGVVEDGEPAFPSARPGDVAVEFLSA